jgi:pilus assembly protein Flp/PilA
MNKTIEMVSDFLRDEEGLTMVEYAIAGSLIAAVAVTAFTTLGTNVQGAADTLNTTGFAGNAAG